MKVVALAGNPNSGKTTIFNNLTGANQHVGNYPGVTVEKKFGHFYMGDEKIEVVDLPGTYSLAGFAEDECVARDFLITEKPDLVLCVVDASNLERSLNLVFQLLEMGQTVAIALNMVDVAKSKGFEIDAFKLSEELGVYVSSVVGRKNIGTDRLKEKIHEALTNPKKESVKFSYSQEIDELIYFVKHKVSENDLFKDTQFSKCINFWTALKLVEQDDQVTNAIINRELHADVVKEVIDRIDKVNKHCRDTLAESISEVISDQRNGFITSIVQKCKQISFERRKDISEKIDMVLTNRILGPIVLFLFLYFAYDFVFLVSEEPVGWLETLVGALYDSTSAALPDGLIKSLICDGIISGVGGVLSFAPLIMFMFFLIAIIEDTGYMARIAFLIDRIFRMFGVHGNSVIAYIVSGGIAGGCAVPGIMATRTLHDKNERLATIMTVPFMNCGAKLPVYALLIAAFFSDHQGSMMFFITVFSWMSALTIALILRKCVFKGKSSPFMMELPPYRMPTFKGIAIHTWQRTWMYIRKAGTFILGASIIVWALMTFPQMPEEKAAMFSSDVERSEAALQYSVAGRLGQVLENVTKPTMGLDWKVDIALIGGAAAKEVIVSTLGTAHSMGIVDDPEDEATVSKLSEKLNADPNWSPVVALSLIMFTMFYCPCVASLAVVKSETRSTKMAVFSAIYSTLVACIFATLFFQIGSLLM